MNGVSDITFRRPLSTQDKHICCMVIAAQKKRKERRKERKEEEKEGWKYKRKYYKLLAVKRTLSCSKKKSAISMHNAQ